MKPEGIMHCSCHPIHPPFRLRRLRIFVMKWKWDLYCKLVNCTNNGCGQVIIIISIIIFIYLLPPNSSINRMNLGITSG